MPDEHLLRIVRGHRRRNEKPAVEESELVVTMAHLTREQVRLFACGKAITDVDGFLAQIASADLWHFARRPLDLQWLIELWRREECFSSLEQMLERSITENLKEPDPDRARIDRLDPWMGGRNQ